MSNREKSDGSGTSSGTGDLYRAVDRWGPEISEWHDRELVRHAREALLADRSFRAYRDGAVTLAARFDVTVAALDERIAASGAVERITRNIQHATAPKRTHWARRIAAIAAVLVASAALGGVYETGGAFPGNASGEVQVVQLDPIVFGMTGPDF